jgi:hypothetical protein
VPYCLLFVGTRLHPCAHRIGCANPGDKISVEKRRARHYSKGVFGRGKHVISLGVRPLLQDGLGNDEQW